MYVGMYKNFKYVHFVVIFGGGWVMYNCAIIKGG